MSGTVTGPNWLEVSNGRVITPGRVYSFTATLTGSPITFDPRPLRYRNELTSVQGIFIDNSAGSAEFSITGSANQTINVATGAQAFAPFYLNDNDVMKLNGNGTVTFLLLNFPTPAAQFPAQSASGASFVELIPNDGQSGGRTNRGGTIAAGGTPQTLAAANAARKGLFISNPPDAITQGIGTAEALEIIVGGDTLVWLAPGQSVTAEFTTGCIDTGAFTVNAATTGHVYTAVEW